MGSHQLTCLQFKWNIKFAFIIFNADPLALISLMLYPTADRLIFWQRHNSSLESAVTCSQNTHTLTHTDMEHIGKDILEFGLTYCRCSLKSRGLSASSTLLGFGPKCILPSFLCRLRNFRWKGQKFHYFTRSHVANR